MIYVIFSSLFNGYIENYYSTIKLNASKLNFPS